MNTWRDRYRPIIAKIIEACGDATLKEKRAALRDGFPSGERKYHPYRIWCDECRVQLKLKPRSNRHAQPDRGQATLNLFNELSETE